MKAATVLLHARSAGLRPPEADLRPPAARYRCRDLSLLQPSRRPHRPPKLRPFAAPPLKHPSLLPAARPPFCQPHPDDPAPLSAFSGQDSRLVAHRTPSASLSASSGQNSLSVRLLRPEQSPRHLLRPEQLPVRLLRPDQLYVRPDPQPSGCAAPPPHLHRQIRCPPAIYLHKPRQPTPPRFYPRFRRLQPPLIHHSNLLLPCSRQQHQIHSPAPLQTQPGTLQPDLCLCSASSLPSPESDNTLPQIVIQI